MKTGAIKAVFFSLIMICCAMLFSACGATVDTVLTADDSFSGKRVITAQLSNSDLGEYVSGGAASIEATVKKYIPTELTYKTSSNADYLIYTFTYEFNGIDDYRTGISSILNADPNNEIEPDISFVNERSPFNRSICFEENFTSLDLLGWLENGLAADKIVSGTDQSNWFELGSSKIVFNGTEYSSYDQLSINDSSSSYASNVDVTTEFLSDSTYNRKIVFTFYTDTIDRINNSGFDTDDYFNSLASDATSVVRTDEENKVIYTASMSGVSAEVIASETSNILCCEAVFGVAVTPDSEGGRSIRIDISEAMSGNYYTRPDSYNAFSSNLYLFDGAECTDSGAAALYRNYDENDRIYYTYYPNYINNGRNAVLSFNWDVNFDDLKVILDFVGAKVKLKLDMSVPTEMLPAAKEVLYSSLSSAAPEKTSLKDSDKDGITTYTLDFGTASAEDAATRYKTFVYNYTGERTDCSFKTEKGLSGSPFSTIKIYSAKMELYPLTSYSEAGFEFRQSGISSLTVLENSNIVPLDEQPDGVYAGTVSGTLNFGAVEKGVNLFGILGVIVLAAASAAFIIAVLVNIKSWSKAVSGSKAASKAAAAVTGMASAAAATASTYIEQVSAAVDTAHNDTDTEDDDDEEDFI